MLAVFGGVFSAALGVGVCPPVVCVCVCERGIACWRVVRRQMEGGQVTPAALWAAVKEQDNL